MSVLETRRVELETDGLQGLSLRVVQVAWEHAVTRLLGKLSQEVCEVGLQREWGGETLAESLAYIYLLQCYFPTTNKQKYILVRNFTQ